MIERTLLRPAAVLAVLAVLILAPSPAPAANGFGRIRLRGGEVIEGEIAKSLGDLCILRSRTGLRSVPRVLIESVAPAVPPPIAPPEGVGGPPPPAAPAPPPASPTPRSLPDPRLDAARAGGPSPVLEIAISGAIAGKPLEAADPFTVARLTHFFAEVSRPRFSVLPPTALTGSGSSPPGVPRAGAAKAGAGRAAQPEYRIEIAAEARPEEIRFYDTPVLKTFCSRISMKLVRLSDKKVVEELAVKEDEGGDPANEAERCRRAYEHGVEKLISELKTLRTFGATSMEASGKDHAQISRDRTGS